MKWDTLYTNHQVTHIRNIRIADKSHCNRAENYIWISICRDSEFLIVWWRLFSKGYPSLCDAYWDSQQVGNILPPYSPKSFTIEVFRVVYEVDSPPTVELRCLTSIFKNLHDLVSSSVFTNTTESPESFQNSDKNLKKIRSSFCRRRNIASIALMRVGIKRGVEDFWLSRFILKVKIST